MLPKEASTLQNKFEKSGMVSAFKTSAFSHHVSPQIHHVFTIKKPRSAPHFSQNPCKKHSSSANIFSARYHKKTRD
jgi:hypothetical protein